MNKFFYFFLSCLFLIAATCDNNTPVSNKKEFDELTLRWIPSQKGLTKEDAIIGMEWILSYLGADLKPNQLANNIKWSSDHSFRFSPNNLGFSQKAVQVINTIITKCAMSDEYQMNESFNLGRFIMLCYNASNHYYAIVDAPKKLEDLIDLSEFDSLTDLYKGESSIAHGARLLFHKSDSTNLLRSVFYAVEGTGNPKKGTFKPVDYEVFDFMPNGQPRFMIYDADGNLKTSAEAELSRAGKPAKCMWCHESNIQPSFKKNPSKKLIAFNEWVYPRREILLENQRALDVAPKFDSLLHHRKGELFYAAFMEPNLAYLSNDTGIDSTILKEKLVGLKTHTTHHFPEFGDIYHRSQIEQFIPWNTIPISSSMWDQGDFEPNFFLND